MLFWDLGRLSHFTNI